MEHRSFPIPIGEEDRLETLEKYQIVGTGSEADYSAIVELVAQIANTPMAAVSLVDKNRTWFKASKGLPVTEMSREESFCAHAVVGNEMLVVEDASIDSRFSAHSVVVTAGGIRFYAGMPLVTPEGHAIGALCVADVVPRTINAQQKASLETLARCIVSLLEYRRMQSLVRELLQIMMASSSTAKQAERMESARKIETEAKDIEKDLRTPVSLISLAVRCTEFLGEDNVLSQIETAADQVQHSSYRIDDAAGKMKKIFDENNFNSDDEDDASSM